MRPFLSRIHPPIIDGLCVLLIRFFLLAPVLPSCSLLANLALMLFDLHISLLVANHAPVNRIPQHSMFQISPARCYWPAPTMTALARSSKYILSLVGILFSGAALLHLPCCQRPLQSPMTSSRSNLLLSLAPVRDLYNVLVSTTRMHLPTFLIPLP